MYQMTDIIEKKKRGMALDKYEIYFFIEGYVGGRIPDYQVAALLMAIYFKGMNEEEIYDLTMAMSFSGDILDFKELKPQIIDKHSTGGVGDKTSLVLIPLIASAGGIIAKMSGRGLGHTGGTIDKMECFKNLDVSMESSKFYDQVINNHIALSGQSDNLAMADKLLYSLRDVTSTVDSIPLIASSIMSKKIASGAGCLVLDVTVGSGAFMKNIDEARKLASLMVKIGKTAHLKTSAVLSDMCQPLGYEIGNALEVKEAIKALNGEGPDDLMEIVFALGAQMLKLSGIASDDKKAREILNEKLESKEALEKLGELIRLQGGDDGPLYDISLLPKAAYEKACLSPKDGYVTKCDALKIGIASMKLGAGRQVKTDSVDLAAGISLKKKIGDRVKKGDTLAVLHFSKKESKKSQNQNLWQTDETQDAFSHEHIDIKKAMSLLESAFEINDTKPVQNPIINEIID